jgi:hypothetical protein
MNPLVSDEENEVGIQTLRPYSKHFIPFITYEWAQ